MAGPKRSSSSVICSPGWSSWASARGWRWSGRALLRGTYHLYQGFGAGLGNVAMGLVFGYAWQRTGRLWPLVIAHGIIDAVAFVGYALLAGHLRWLR